MFGVMRLGVRHVVEHRTGIHPKPFGNLNQTLRTKRALGIDVQTFTLTATVLNRQLTRHRECVHQLRLPGAKLPVHLGHAPALNPAL